MRVVNSNWAIEKAMKKFLEDFDLPVPTSNKHDCYRWDPAEKDPQIYFSLFSSPAVSICYRNGYWSMSTFHLDNGILCHMDFRGRYSSENDVFGKIFSALSSWAEEYWMKNIT